MSQARYCGGIFAAAYMLVNTGAPGYIPTNVSSTFSAPANLV